MARRKDPERTALVVDDDGALARLVVFGLTHRGFRAESVDSFAAAASAIHRRVYDVCVFDVRLRDGSGLDLLRRVRAASPETWTILMSCDPLGQSATPDGFLRKPFRPADLRRVLDARETTSPGRSETVRCEVHHR